MDPGEKQVKSRKVEKSNVKSQKFGAPLHEVANAVPNRAKAFGACNEARLKAGSKAGLPTPPRYPIVTRRALELGASGWSAGWEVLGAEMFWGILVMCESTYSSTPNSGDLTGWMYRKLCCEWSTVLIFPAPGIFCFAHCSCSLRLFGK